MWLLPLIVESTPWHRGARCCPVRFGARRKGHGSQHRLRQTLLSASSVGYSISASGRYVSQELFKKLGIENEMKAKAHEVKSLTPVARGRRARDTRERGRGFPEQEPGGCPVTAALPDATGDAPDPRTIRTRTRPRSESTLTSTEIDIPTSQGPRVLAGVCLVGKSSRARPLSRPRTRLCARSRSRPVMKAPRAHRRGGRRPPDRHGLRRGRAPARTQRKALSAGLRESTRGG